MFSDEFTLSPSSLFFLIPQWMFKEREEDSETEVISGVFFIYDVISYKTTFFILFTIINSCKKLVKLAGLLTHFF